MIDSTNPRQLADNIRKLWDKFKSISGDLLPSRSTATTGQILKLTGENKTPSWADEYSYTPPSYPASGEVNTGQKWIDGKDIYIKTVTGTIPQIAAGDTAVVDLGIVCNTLIDAVGHLDSDLSEFSINSYFSNIRYSAIRRGISTGSVVIVVSQSYSEYPYTICVRYTKPDPAPETRDDDTQVPVEPEEKKTTRKKTTK